MIVKADSLLAKLACLLPAKLVSVTTCRVGTDTVNFVKIGVWK